MLKYSAHKAWGCVQYTRLMFIVMVAFEVGKGSKHYCRHMWKFAFGFTVAELKNRLGTMNAKSNRKHVDNEQSFSVYLSFMFIFTKWKRTVYGTELVDLGARIISEYVTSLLHPGCNPLVI